MSDKIIVTGFDRFGPLNRPNRSSEVALPAIKEKYGDLVETLVLPTAYDVAAEQLKAAISSISPAAVVMFGVSAASKVRLEQQAKNRRANLIVPDNNGVRAFGRIEKTGQPTYASTLPLGNIYKRLNNAGIPTTLSSSAGSFVCNEVMYKALQHNELTAIPTGFIHFGNGLSDQMIEETAMVVVDELSANLAT